jgi:hypothetical protein
MMVRSDKGVRTMAKVSAHGAIIGTVYFNTSAKRYMSDGVVLRNAGHGWKLHARLKTGATPAEAYARQLAKLDDALTSHPHNAAYRKALHDAAGLSVRWKLHAAIAMMPDDPDGVWSEACDGYGDNASADIDEVVKLCQLYKLAAAEAADGRPA